MHEIMKLTGHKKERSFMRYVKATRDIDMNIIESVLLQINCYKFELIRNILDYSEIMFTSGTAESINLTIKVIITDYYESHIITVSDKIEQDIIKNPTKK